MKALKAILILSLLVSSSVSMAKSPHDSDASHIDVQMDQGRVLAAEYNLLSSEVERLENKLSRALDKVQFNHISRDEGRIVALISNQVESDLEEIKKLIEELNYETSSNSIYEKLREIEKDIKMI
jgi:hypothetical protein